MSLAEGPVDLVVPLAAAPTGRRHRAWARDPSAAVGGAVLVLVGAALAAAPWLARTDPLLTDVPNRLAGSSWAHPLGTDGIGRDEWSRILYGGRTSVLLAVVATVGITILGVALGVLAGVRGGVVDSIVMRVVEVLQALPFLLVVIAVVALVGGGTTKLVATVILLGWPGYARVVRAAALSIRERDFVGASRALGSSRLSVTIRHVVPNLLGPVIVLSTLDLGRILLALSTLSFLGVGVRPPEPEWGSMLAEAREYFYRDARMLIFPGLAITIVVLAVNLFGDGLRRSLHGRMGQR